MQTRTTKTISTTRRRRLDILDYVKNTGKPKTYRGGGGVRGGSRPGAGRPSSNTAGLPQINLYFNTGGREVLYNQTQPHPYNPQHLPVNIQNAQPNQQAVAGYNAQQRIDITDLRNQQAQMNQNIIQLRDRIAAQAMNPNEQQLLQQQIQASQQQNAQILQQVRTHNANTADGLTLNRLATDQLRNQLEVANKISFHNAIQTLNVGQGYKRATQEELVRDLDAEILSTAQERLLEAMKKQLYQPEASRGRGAGTGAPQRPPPPIPPPSQRPREAGAGPSSSDSEEEQRTLYMSSRPDLMSTQKKSADADEEARDTPVLFRGIAMSPDLQVRDLDNQMSGVNLQGAAGGRPPNVVQGSRIMPPLELTNSRSGRQLPVTQLTNSRQGHARQDHQSEVVQRLANAFANQEIGVSDDEPLNASASRLPYNLFSDDNSEVH